MLGCAVSWPMLVGEHLVHADAAAGRWRPSAAARPRADCPVCPGWMPMPTAGLLNRPLMTLIFVFSGSSGCEALAQLHLGAAALGPPVVAVDAVAHEQHGEALWERAGRARGVAGCPTRAATRATAAPSSRRRRAGTVRRESDCCSSRSPLCSVWSRSLGQELRAGDDALDQAVEAIAVARRASRASRRSSARPTACRLRPSA